MQADQIERLGAKARDFRIVSSEIHRVMGAHLANHHAPIPGPRTDAPAAVPFQRDRIPDHVLAAMVESMETGNLDQGGLGSAFGYPQSLINRELARYHGANRRYHARLARG